MTEHDDDPRDYAREHDRWCAALDDKADAERDDRMQGVGGDD